MWSDIVSNSDLELTWFTFTYWTTIFIQYIAKFTSYFAHRRTFRFCNQKLALLFFFNLHGNDVCFILEQHGKLDFESATSLKQQYMDKHVAPFGLIILIPSQSVFALFP